MTSVIRAGCAWRENASGGNSLEGGGVTRKWILTMALAVAGAGSYVLIAGAQMHQHEMAAPAMTQGDGRQLVQFPEPMRLHTITSMRDHLLALQEIDMALSRNDFNKAASVAEGRLGMSSLELHGAAQIAPFMPQGMQDIGTQMHRSASRFAVEAQDASVSNDVRPALAGLGAVMQQCVACHAAYRLH
jgi:hypothetical protein